MLVLHFFPWEFYLSFVFRFVGLMDSGFLRPVAVCSSNVLFYETLMSLVCCSLCVWGVVILLGFCSTICVLGTVVVCLYYTVEAEFS